MIQKEIVLEIAGKTCSKLNCNRILTDTENNDNLIVDAVETVDNEDVIYYRDIAINMEDLPEGLTLTQSEIDELKYA